MKHSNSMGINNSESKRNCIQSFPNNSFYNSSSSIRGMMESKGLIMQKRFGQNFLINQGVRERIVEAMDINLEAALWEIGPGMGAITTLMVDKCKTLRIFEIDRGFIEMLESFSANISHLEVVAGDALKNWPILFEKEGSPDAVVGNLPYNVGSLLIASFIEKGLLSPVMVFTLQKEVALRMEGKPGSKLYSSFTMLCSLDYEIKRLFDISPGSFYPKPDVLSSAVQLKLKVERELHGVSLDCLEVRKKYFKLVRDLFKSRRKTIRNNWIKSGALSSLDKGEALALLLKCGIDPGDRGENLGYEKVWHLASLV